MREFDWFRGKIGIVFQNDRLMPWRTALDNVALGARAQQNAARERQEIAAAWLARLGLAGHENDYPHALSGGMRQRVSIARAFAGKPDILLCDEPFSALDEHTGNALREEFRELLRQTGATSIFITHSIEEALQLGERLMVFERPARIAYEATLRADMSETEREAVRGRIRQVLSGEHRRKVNDVIIDVHAHYVPQSLLDDLKAQKRLFPSVKTQEAKGALRSGLLWRRASRAR